MILRTGFVSNSSSSSFVIPKTHFPTIWDLAEAMIRYRDDGGENEDGSLAVIEGLRESGCEVDSVTFDTPNFDTFIHDADDEWWITTCNNVSFYEMLGSVNNGGRLLDMYRGDFLGDYIDYEMEKDHNFLNLSHGNPQNPQN
jgi:hypothetical protein